MHTSNTVKSQSSAVCWPISRRPTISGIRHESVFSPPQHLSKVSPSVTSRSTYDTPTREEQIAGEKVIPGEAQVSGVCGSGKDRYRWLTLWEKVCRRNAGVNKAGETKGWFRTKANTAFMEITAHDDYFQSTCT
ncbi:hypothetical protein WJX77_008384 [Trebouxia sp. C0004]